MGVVVVVPESLLLAPLSFALTDPASFDVVPPSSLVVTLGVSDVEDPDVLPEGPGLLVVPP